MSAIPSTQESFADLFEASLTRQEMRQGEVITAEIVRINNMIVKKKLLEVTLDFLEPFHLFFERQYNVS